MTNHLGRSTLVLVAVAVGLLGAAHQRPALARQTEAPERIAIRRADLASAYRRLDGQFMRRIADRACEPPEGIDPNSEEWRRWTLLDEEELQRMNTGADRAALSFLGGDPGQVAAQMNALLAQRPGDESDEEFLVAARSLRFEAAPAWPTAADLLPDGPFRGECTFNLSSIYPLPEGITPPSEMALAITFDEKGSSTSSFNQLMLHMDGARRLSGTARVHFDQPHPPGTRVIALRSSGRGFALPDAPRRTFEQVGKWTILPEAFEEALDRLSLRLDAVALRDANDDQPLAQDLLRSRIGLLELAESQSESIAIVTDYAQLIEDLDRECTLIEGGFNPYADRDGDFWFRVRLIGDIRFPVRIYVPRSALQKESMPLVIALHGAGGDENLFMEAYGDGIIKRLADEHGFAVVSPQASPLMDLGMAFDSIVAVMSSLHEIDESRIYVLGHSLGAMMTGGMSAARRDRIAAACWMAGASFARGATIPPTLAISAELDMIIAPARVKAAVDVARRAGMEVEYREIDDLGHVLMVGYVLPDALDWLLKHTLE